MYTEIDAGPQAAVNQVPVVGLASLPDVARLADGRTITVFVSGDQVIGRLAASSRGDPEDPHLQGRDLVLGTASGGSITNLHVTALADGGFATAWVAGLSAYAATFHADGSAHAAPFTVYGPDLSGRGNALNSQFADDVSIAGLADGTVEVAFEAGGVTQTGPGTFDHTRYLAFDIRSAAGEFISRGGYGPTRQYEQQFFGDPSTDPSTPPDAGDKLPHPATVVTADGGFVTAYAAYDAGGAETLKIRKVDAGGTTRASASLAADGFDPSLAVLADGTIAIAWDGQDGDIHDATVSGLDLSLRTAIGTANALTSGAQSAPTVAAVAPGRFAITWADDDPGRTAGADVAIRVFSENGAALTAQQVLNRQETGDQLTPRTIALGTGVLETVWDDRGGPPGADPAVVSAITAVRTFGEAFAVDGSQGVQSLTGQDDAINFISTATAAGTGDVVVRLPDSPGSGSVSKGGRLDATLSNIQGVQLGADTSIVYGSAVPSDVPQLIYGGSGHLEYHEAGAGSIIQGSSKSSTVVGAPNTVGHLLFYGHGARDIMLAGGSVNTMVANADPASTSLFAGSHVAVTVDGRTLEEDTIDGNGGTVTVYGGVASQVLHGGSGTNTLVGNTTPYDEDSRTIDKGVNVLYGGTGSAAGTDIFYAGIGVNLLFEGAGTDTFVGNAGTDHIVGGSGRSFVYGGTGDQVIDTGAGNQYLYAGSGNTVLNETAANLTAGRGDWIEGFRTAAGPGQPGTYLDLPTAARTGTTFQALNGGTLVLAPSTDGTGQAGLFVAHAAVAAVQAQTFFTL